MKANPKELALIPGSIKPALQLQTRNPWYRGFPLVFTRVTTYFMWSIPRLWVHAYAKQCA